MYRFISRCRGLVVRYEQKVFFNQDHICHRYATTLHNTRHHSCLPPFTLKCTPYRYRSVIRQPPKPLGVQPCRGLYNPFDSDPTHQEIEERTELTRQQTRQQKHMRLQESQHSTHSPYTTEEEETADSILYKDHRIVGWYPDQVYNVVMDVADYEKFIPYCIKSTVHTKTVTKRNQFMEADLQVGFNLYQLSYTSKVNGSTTLDGKKLITAVCENKALFDHLNMEWAIEPGPIEHTASMHFDVSFKFSNGFYNSVATLFKSSVIDQMVPAFEARLREIHGEPTLLSSLASTKVHRRKKRR